jgi:hypothetical protein
MFRNKPANPALGAALQQGGSAPQTQTPFSGQQAPAPQNPFGNMAQAASHQLQGNSQFGPAMHQFADSRNSSPLTQLAGRFPNTGVSGAMPGGMGMPQIVGSTPAEHRALGAQAGQDMSWMNQPGAVQSAPSAAVTSPGVSPEAKAAARAALLGNGFGGSLDGGGMKIDSQEHGKKSPKYSFAQTAMDLGLNGRTEDLPAVLSELQKRDPRFANFQIGGNKKDHLVYNGDPNALDPAFDGVRDIDAVLSAGEGGKGFTWGIGGGAPAPHMLGMPAPISVGNMDASQIAALGQQPDQNLDAAGSASMLQQILSKLQNPQQQALSQALRTY